MAIFYEYEMKNEFRKDELIIRKKKLGKMWLFFKNKFQKDELIIINALLNSYKIIPQIIDFCFEHYQIKRGDY